ncbi:MAG TPA: recombinase family protein [Leptolyngbyaceae cyanobacterium]
MERLSVGYARVSFREQAESSQALAEQRARIEAASADLIFKDSQLDSDNSRPDFLKLMKLIQAGRVKQLYVTSLDRLTRSLKTLEGLAKELENHGVTLVVLDQESDHKIEYEE